MFRKPLLFLLILAAAGGALHAQLPPLVPGAEAGEELFSPVLAGSGAFSTSRDGVHAAAVNPAALGELQRITLDAGYLLLTDFGSYQFGHALNLGLSVPTKFAVFGGSANYLYSPFFHLLEGSGHHIRGNLFAAKDIYPGLTVGLGLNVGGGGGLTLAGDLGVRYNMGKLGSFENMTFAFAMKGLGKSSYPSAFTPLFGASADFLHIRSTGDTADPLLLSGALDLSIPSMHNLALKIGARLVLAEMITISAAWGINGYENIWGSNRVMPPLPSLGVGLNFTIKTRGQGLMGGRLPTDGDIAANLALKPISGPIYAIGGGATWSMGVVDRTPPQVFVEYPETVYFSPNNDGLADALEFPVRIQDQRYVNEWIFEIKNDAGEVVRTYRNKELRPETQGVKNIMLRLIQVKAGVEIPSSLRWDGTLDSGELAPDGNYHFTVTAADDNGNVITTEPYEVVVDNTPPEIIIRPLAESERIFSPDGDGSKDTIVIAETGSWEELWEADIWDSQGNKVKSFTLRETELANIEWDGTDDAGRIVGDGVYQYRVRATDRALNTEEAALENIIISTIQPTVNLAVADAWFSPNGDGAKDLMTVIVGLPVREGITGWEFQIRDRNDTVRRTLAVSGSPPPERIDFDGLDDSGAPLAEGTYYGRIAVSYRNGYLSSASSPYVTLDLTPPRSSVKTGYDAFSPNNDGNQDVMVFLQEGSAEVLWLGTVRRAEATEALRVMRMAGVPPARLEWDGLDDTGALAPDGEYRYRLSATDPAGNRGESNEADFTLSTADTPVFITTDFRSFSPNGDGVKDTISLLPQIQERAGINSYRVEILDAGGRVLRFFEGQNTVPAAISWNGRDSGNAAAPDGAYTARITVRYAAGNQPEAVSRSFILDTVQPAAAVSAPYTVFSPNGDGARDTLPLGVETQGDDSWTAEITGSDGAVIRSWTWTGAAPELSWDGNDEAGNSVPDGTYRFSVISTDDAGNSTRRVIESISLDARVPRAFLTASASGIAPKGPQTPGIRLGTMLSIREGVESWRLELRDDAGTVLRSWPEAASPETPASGAPPETIVWNGLDAAGAVKEGRYSPELTVIYVKGDVVSAQAGAITVDVSGPELSFRSAPDYFSPDNDGVEDELSMFLSARDASPITNWSLEVREPEPPHQLFYRIEGRGTPAERTIWDGRSSRGELVQSASDYPVQFRAVDSLGNESLLEAKIGVDVLVIRDGDRLRIQVPSIVFRPSAADFVGLPPETVENNNRILRRIAQILNKFRDYRVQVEGHANPVLQTVKEQVEELQPLSEARAQFTVNALAGFGVSRNRLTHSGAGGTRPVVSPNDRDNRWKNRRVEFLLIK
ncbi:MAG: OmpA family protein [Spirochaetaceae bacterium]|jgi:flagellar hook assembly protein FlgD/flagellar motor protein MotB|nr:OmpA family protein [Spirochaetaceae bacterium]